MSSDVHKNAIPQRGHHWGGIPGRRSLGGRVWGHSNHSNSYAKSTDSSNPPHHSHSFLLEAPYQMNNVISAITDEGFMYLKPALCCFLQRNSAALQSLFNVLETWHGSKAKRWIHGGLKGELLNADGCPACFEIYLNNFHVLLQYVASCNGKNVAKINFFDSGTEMKPQVDHISQDPKIPNKMIYAKRKSMKIHENSCSRLIGQGQKAIHPPRHRRGGSGAKTSTFLNTLWDCLILSIFHAQKWKRTLETTGQLLQNIPLTACFLESDMLRMLRIIDSKK